MQCFMLPKGICQQIDDINKKFFWNKDYSYFHPLLSWDAICRPKQLGRPGLHKSEHLNIALQLKLLWKILTDPDNIWVRLISEKYLQGSSILTFRKKRVQSWQFSRLLHLRNIFKKGLRIG